MIFSTAAQANSLVKTLSYKLIKAGYNQPIGVGIGMAYGRALMIKAGYNGSGIADVVYMGDVVNQAAKLAAQGSNGDSVPPVMIDDVFAANLNEYNQKISAHVTSERLEPWLPHGERREYHHERLVQQELHMSTRVQAERYR